MNVRHALGMVAISVILSACASRSADPVAPAPMQAASAAGQGPTRTVKSRDGAYSGQVIGTPTPNSKFAQLRIGMETTEVQKIVGRFPDEIHSYESGKRWIPFYFGNDARRSQVLYKGEGCLIFTAGGAFSSGGDLIQIEFDPSGGCYQP